MQTEGYAQHEVRPQRHKKGKLNMVLKYHGYDNNVLRAANNMGTDLARSFEMTFSLEITALGILFRSSLSDGKPSLSTAVTLNVQQQSSEILNTLTVKCYRRRMWETQHSGATGWELLSHFSDVWCSWLLQLTRGSIWQRESLFRCQMWPHWMYVSNNVIK